MKEVPLSLCERSALLESLKSRIRLDGRDFMDIRNVEINFGKDYGCCTVSLGETRVLSQVTCEVVEPRPSRPNEGKLSIAVHLSPMAAPHFEQGRWSDIDEIQQVLDRNIKESRCVDLESLCIMAEESVWQFKVDVTVLNHGGNLGDACNLSAVAALRHFHRPDVTVEEDGRVTIHTDEERELIPTFLKKIPVCLTYALFGDDDDGFITILDPTDKEERVMSGKLVVGLNPHGEITSLLLPGKLCLDKNYIMFCVTQAFSRAKNIAETVMTIVEEDLEKRKTSIKVDGYLNCLTSDRAYNKKLIMDKIKSVGNMEVKSEVESKNDMDEEVMEDLSNYHETTLSQKMNKKGVNEKVNDKEDSSSEEEFSAELLSKSLPEIKEEKKKNKSKKKKNKSESKVSEREKKKKIKNMIRVDDDDDTEMAVMIDKANIK